MYATTFAPGRTIPWDPGKGPGRSWLDDFLKRHLRLSGQSSRIYEASKFATEVRLAHEICSRHTCGHPGHNGICGT
ncbi:unnamed protein product [Ectocarpus fasciculatus]